MTNDVDNLNMGRRRKYRVGIIGCGRVASLLEQDYLRGHPCTHAGGYDACPKTKIVAGCDIDEERLRLFKKEWGAKHIYTDYQDMLTKEDLDIVSICSWTDTHREMAIASAEAGVRGVICEKPMALNLADADEIIESCREHGTKLIINHERRWDANYQKVRELIGEGAIGELRTIVGNVLTGAPAPRDWHADYHQVGGGPMLHDGTHLVDMIRFFGGEPDWVFGHIERRTEGIYVEDIATAFIHLKSGAHASIEGGGIRNYFNFELDVQGSQGRILIGNGAMGMWVANKSPHYLGFMELEQKPFPRAKNGGNPWVLQVEDMICCLENGHESISSGYEGRAALELVMGVYESARLGGIKVPFPLNIRKSPLDFMLREGRL